MQVGEDLVRDTALETLEQRASPRTQGAAKRVPTPWSRRCLAWALGLVIALVVAAVPIIYYRYSYTHSKRLREVTPGKRYRSGCMTAAGFRDAIERLGIRTIINLMDEAPDPDLPLDYFSRQTQAESELCRELDVRYVVLTADLVGRQHVRDQHPAAI